MGRLMRSSFLCGHAVRNIVSSAQQSLFADKPICRNSDLAQRGVTATFVDCIPRRFGTRRMNKLESELHQISRKQTSKEYTITQDPY